MNAIVKTRTQTERLAQRRERLLDEGEKLFLSKGYAGASVNEIVRMAGGSLATLYGEFGSKEGLFAEIMRRRASSIFDCDTAVCDRYKSPRAALHVLATRLLDKRLSDDFLALYRIAVNEGPRFPALREAIVNGSFRGFIGTLAETLVELGFAKRKDGVVAAEEFVSLVHGTMLFRAACGHGAAITPKQRAQHVDRAVEAFMQLHPLR
ncbi:MAG TPA: TetR/AcrR family transcriptional regulator [Steroidobacteraceae bacterium]|nr:TetR/AcrR family transcriptional regulator [Steroidobacteraceae bacterium]